MKQLIEIDTDSQVVVPREPTTEMIDKAYKLGADAHVSEIYQLMLDSAPQPQEQAVQEDEQLRFKSACEISGPKHPEYVKGYEAAMDAVSKAQEQDVQPSEVPTGHVYLPEITPEMWEMLGDTDVMDWIDGPQWTQIAVDFASVLPVKMPEKPAQAVAVQGWLPIESAPDCLHLRAIWLHNNMHEDWILEVHSGYVDDDGRFVNQYGDDYGLDPEHYFGWQPIPDGDPNLTMPQPPEVE